MENLELHFWNEESYNIKKVSDFLSYIFREYCKEINITYINFNLKNNITEEIYENNRLFLNIKWYQFEENRELIHIIHNFFIEKIMIIDSNWIEKKFYIHYSEWNIFYTYEFPVHDWNNKEVFYETKNTYIDLINIFQPHISNWWFEVIWQNISDIKERKIFEWLFWYISSDFLNQLSDIWDNFYKLNSWILFYITDTFEKNDISKILKFK